MRTRSATGAARPASSLVAPLTVSVCTIAAWISAVAVVNAAELKAKTLEAWERYVTVTEARMQTELEGEAPFLWVDRLADDEREEAYARLRAGEVVIERLETRDGDDKIDMPDGRVHHWIGTALIPGVTLDQTMALVQDYPRYAEIYGPDVRESRVLEQDGSRFRVYFQFYTKKVWTVVLNTEHDVEYQLLDDARAYVPSRSTRIVEIEHPDTPETSARSPRAPTAGRCGASTTTARSRQGTATSTCNASRSRSAAGFRSSCAHSLGRSSTAFRATS